MNDEMKGKSGKVKVMYVRSDDDSDKRTHNPRTGKGGGRPGKSRADGGRRPARYAAEVYRAVQVADHRRIHQPQQRDGDVGENHREGKTPQRFIGSVEQHV